MGNGISVALIVKCGSLGMIIFNTYTRMGSWLVSHIGVSLAIERTIYRNTINAKREQPDE
jgi:uncharacterized protein (DUF1684 family)